jgi:hypothetical protein
MSLDKTLITEVKRCADLSTDVNIKSVELAKGTFKGCISSSKKFDDKTRDALLKLIDSVPAPEAQYNIWLNCYADVMGYNKPGYKQKPLVVLMDSHIKDVVYCEHTQKIGGSNADDIINLIKDLPLAVATVSTNLEWKDDQRVIDMQPALVVLHASAFYKETQEIGGNQRLLDFLDSFKKMQTKILVYTRGLPEQPSDEILDRWKKLLDKLNDPDLKKHAELFIMPKGHESCFDDPEVANPFKKKIKEMLALK